MGHRQFEDHCCTSHDTRGLIYVLLLLVTTHKLWWQLWPHLRLHYVTWNMTVPKKHISCSRFPQLGWSSALLLLDAEPKQADLPPWSPLSAGRKFSVVRRRRSHHVSPSISRSRQHVKTQCFDKFKHWTKAWCLTRTTAHWQMSNMGISSSP